MTAPTLALLFVGAVAAAAISGAVGFGGALLLLPLLTRTVGVDVGVPLLTVAQLVGNLSVERLSVARFRVVVGVLLIALAVQMIVLG